MRRHEYQQRKSASNVHQRRHRSQSQSQPKATKTSVIVANASVQRTTHPTDNKICVFQYTPRTLPVEPRFCGVFEDPREWNPSQHPWYLKVRRLLHLNRVSVENSIAYITTHCYRMKRIFAARPDGVNIATQGSPVYEFGRHVYANRDGYLYMIEMWKGFRNSDNLLYSEEHSINDVLPKIRYNHNRRRNETINTLSVSCQTDTIIYNWRFPSGGPQSRWWHKYGREKRTRFFEWESIKDFEEQGTSVQQFSFAKNYLIHKYMPHFGVFVWNSAKLILRDTITKGFTNDYNHTLVQSGVFIAVQGFCGLTFMDNTQRVYSLRELRTKVFTNPIIVVSAVPSVGESVCWGLTIGDELSMDSESTVRWAHDEPIMNETMVVGMDAILSVPLLGMNENRTKVYNWSEGLQFVHERQREFDYEQFVGIDSYPNLSLSEHDVRSAQFVANERLDYPRV